MFKKHTMNAILCILGISTLLFTIAMIVIFCLYREVPDILIERYFTCVVGEGGFMAIIKTAKTIMDRKAGPQNILESTEENIFEEIEEENQE